MEKRINIAIAEDHDMVRQGFIRMLGDYKEFRILFEAQNGSVLLSKLQDFEPDVLLLDIKMPVMDGQTAMKEIKSKYPTIKIIVISAHSEYELIIQNVRLGANGFLPKHAGIETLKTAITHVVEDGFFFEDDILDLLDKAGLSPLGGIKPLNTKEKEILVLLCENRSPDDICTLARIQLGTVRWYKNRIMNKTNTKDLHELREYALKHKYLQKKAT